MKQKIKLSESDLHRIIRESVKRVLCEARGLQSKKLYDILKQHGGFRYKRGVGDRHSLKDDDIIGVVDYSDKCDREKLFTMAERNGIIISNENADDIYYDELRDGKYIVYVLRAGNFDRRNPQPEGSFKDLIKKRDERERSRTSDRYQYGLNNAERGIRNPWFRGGDDDRNNWSKESKQWLVGQTKDELEKRRQERMKK